MSEARVADALARLDEHHQLHLPLRRGDLLGRLALRVLWRRQLKWQMETNIATRDAVRAIADLWREQRSRIDQLADRRELITVDQLNHELALLHRNDQNVMAGLNQRLYAAIGRIQTQLGDLRLEFTERAEHAGEIEQRIKALEQQCAELSAAARDVRLRHAQLDLFLDRARHSLPDPPEPAVAEAVPDRDSFLELAVPALLDGPAEHAREARGGYLPAVRAARDGGATGPVLDMAPGRGEWWEVLRSAGVPYRSASRNALVRKHCAELGCELADDDPLDLLAAAAYRCLGAVTAFRYVERQEPATLARFADLASSALQPGGVLIIETPADGERFHLDPYARRPVHPDFLRFLVEAAGFSRVETMRPDADRHSLLAWR